MSSKDSAYTRWSCHSGLTNYVQIVSTPPAPAIGARLPYPFGAHHCVVSTNSLDPCLWGGGGGPHQHVFGPPASLPLHPASSSITPAGSVHKSKGDNVVRMWVQVKRRCVLCMWVLHRGHSGDGCDLASTLCKYDLRKGDLFVLSWTRVRRVRRGSLSSELLMCGGGVRSILLLPLVARCIETIHVC